MECLGLCIDLLLRLIPVYVINKSSNKISNKRELLVLFGSLYWFTYTTDHIYFMSKSSNKISNKRELLVMFGSLYWFTTTTDSRLFCQPRYVGLCMCFAFENKGTMHDEQRQTDRQTYRQTDIPKIPKNPNSQHIVRRWNYRQIMYACVCIIYIYIYIYIYICLHTHIYAHI